MRVGILGLAHPRVYDYLKHLRTLADVEVIGVWDQDGARARQVAAGFEVAVHTAPETLLGQQPDGAIVCAPPAARHALVAQAAEAASWLMCEVPLGATLADARAMAEACESRGAKLLPAFTLRFAPALLALKQWLDEGKLGQLLSVKLAHPGKRPAGGAATGGAVFQRAPHALDLMRWLLATEVAEVYAEIGKGLLHAGMDSDDVGLLSVALANGVYATLDVSWSLPPTYPTHESLGMEIIGDAGSVRLDAFRQNIDLYADDVAWVNWGSDAARELLRHYISCMAEGQPPAAGAQDAIRAQEIVQAAYQSASVGAPVKV